MKRKLSALIFYCVLCTLQSAFGQGGTWTWISGSKTLSATGVFGVQGVPSINNHPPALYEAAEWKDKQGNFWLYGGWQPNYCDMWMFKPSTLEWTWVKGPGVPGQSPVYGVQGQFNPANTPGERFAASATWVDTSGTLWLFGGDAVRNDLWKYDIGINQWAWMKGDQAPNTKGSHGVLGVPSPSNLPGSRQETCSAWVDSLNNLWLYGGVGYDESGIVGWLSDLWKYDISKNEWTWMKGSAFRDVPANYGVKGVANSTNDPGARASYTKWKDKQGNFWLMGGQKSSYVANDVWRYEVKTNQWTWMSGSSSTGDIGKYQANCVFDTVNIPYSRMEQRSAVTDNLGKFWLFGGADWPAGKYFNDLWVFDPQKVEWNWISGTNVHNQTGNYGTLGVPSPSNIPPSRMGAVAWWGNDCKFYMFGGLINGLSTCYADLWVFEPDNNCVPFCSIASLPHADFASSDTGFCSEPIKCIDFFDHSANNPTSWKWVFPGAVPDSSDQKNPTNICYYTPGTYAVTLIVSNAAGNDTLTVSPMITVGGTPAAPSITASNDTLFCSPASSYQWYYNGIPVTGATDSTFIAVNDGTYNVYITDSLGCGRLGDGIVWTSVNGIVDQSSEFKVYPNPVEDKLTVYGLEFIVGTTIQIYNVLGERIFSTQPETVTRKPETVIDVTSLPKGVYVILLTIGDSVYRGKFIKD